MNIIVINLHNRPNRFLNTLNELRKQNLHDYIIRKEACSIERAKKEYFKFISIKAIENINNLKSTIILPTWGAVACAISHKECWKYIIDNNLPYAIIIEDDLEIIDKYKFNINLNRSLDVVKQYLTDNLFITFNSKIRNSNSLNNVEKINNAFTNCQFYIINNNMATNLYSNCINITYQIDIQIGLTIKKFNNNYTDKCLNFNDSGICHSKKFKSDIQYYFLKYEDLQCLNLDDDIIHHILTFLPNKKNIINYEFYDDNFNEILYNNYITL
tara:strand:+ start:2281 stop:3093 length:813 start_codon:yes stop_codon:yes gene_type:complete